MRRIAAIIKPRKPEDAGKSPAEPGGREIFIHVMKDGVRPASGRDRRLKPE